MNRWFGEIAWAVFVVVVAPAAAMTLAASASLACTNLATISLSSESGHPGDSIVLTGTSFPVPRASAGLPATPVEVHWKGVDGPLLGTATPDRSGTISLTFTVPESAPGPAVIVATQRRPVLNPNVPDAPPTLTDEYGTPARATLRVLAPGERATTLARQPEFVPLSTEGNSTALMVMLVLSGAVALSLFGGGVIAFLHQIRLRRLVAQPWQQW
jgi:hypothetical protein